MRERLSKIRAPEKDIKLSVQITHSILILLFGIALGALSKQLDNMSINDAIPWQRILGILDLRNVFSELAIWLLISLAISVFSGTPLRASLNVFLFFAGMCCSYHLYTIVFSGFNPRRYMMIWYGFTVLSPALAFVCWFGKGKTKVSLVIDTLILTVMISECFSIGLWYFDFKSIINTLIFIGSATVLYNTPKYTVIGLSGAVALSLAAKAVLF
ncbi:MAG: hypothetical protein J1F64_07215 [Oscillospiraceae bacterium]|nr:hypothetical protein [Oscillospiraceae bacterium]